jgi:hypothetical protein
MVCLGNEIVAGAVQDHDRGIVIVGVLLGKDWYNVNSI